MTDHRLRNLCLICLGISSIICSPTSILKHPDAVPNTGAVLEVTHDVLDTIHGFRNSSAILKHPDAVPNTGAVLEVTHDVLDTIHEFRNSSAILKHPDAVPNTGAVLEVTRDVLDTIHGFWNCWNAFRVTKNFPYTSCKCKQGWGTVMSNSDEEWDCRVPREVECEYSLGEHDERDVYVITSTFDAVKIYPPISGNFSVRGVYLWNRGSRRTNGAKGYWDDVTDVAMKFFTLNNTNSNRLSIKNLTLDIWKGHVLKIDFGGAEKCAVAKFKGRIKYPIDIEDFKRSISPVSTTKMSPTTEKATTTSPTVATTATKISLSTTTDGKASTTAATVTTKSMTSTSSTRLKTTTRDTTTPKRKKEKQIGRNTSKSSTIGIAVGVVLLLLLVVTLVVFVVRRRSKSRRNNDSDDICIENTNRKDVTSKNIAVTSSAGDISNDGTDNTSAGKKSHT